MSQNSVRVVNSKGVTITRTTPKSAERLVKRGTHRMRGNAIEIIEGDHRVSPEGCVPRKQRQTYVNGDGFASIAAIKGLPVAGDVIRLLMGKRPAQSPRDLPTVEVSHQALPLSEPQLIAPHWDGVPLVSAESYQESVRRTERGRE